MPRQIGVLISELDMTYGDPLVKAFYPVHIRFRLVALARATSGVSIALQENGNHANVFVD